MDVAAKPTWTYSRRVPTRATPTGPPAPLDSRGFARVAPCCGDEAAPRRRWASISQRVGAGRADEVVLGKAADIVGGETHHAAVIVDTQIGVVVFPVGHEGQRIHER